MVRIDQVQRGLAAFIDRDLIPSLSGWDKVLVGGGAGILTARLPQMISQHPVVATLGLYDAANNQVDIDAMHQYVTPYIGAEALPLKIPMLGITVKIGKQEIDALYRYIKEA